MPAQSGGLVTSGARACQHSHLAVADRPSPLEFTVRQRIRALRQNESGFTLIELLIVIVILGVLAGIVVFAVSAFNNDGVTTACRADVKNVEIASEAYYAKTGAYAHSIDDSAGATPATAASLVGAGYLKQKPNSTKYTVTYTPAGGATPDYSKAPTIAGTSGGSAC